ncbi:hypothetical protein, partial [Serratia marcescens]|uniref:hypothetical protein n=1 Tax=Serratia marcescens TaxID=615 RepID=UPI003174B928
WSTSKTPSYTKSVSWQHHRNDRPVTSIVINLINEAQNSREYAERGIRVSGYSTFKNTSQNTFEVNGDGTGYGEVRLSMLPIKSDGRAGKLNSAMKIRKKGSRCSAW